MDEIPTFEEYKAAVIESLLEDLPRATKTGFNNFINSEEIKDVVNRRYKSYVNEYKNGRFPGTAWKGAEASLAYCLYMMYRE